MIFEVIRHELLFRGWISSRNWKFIIKSVKSCYN
jgi:hypothetical protein